MENNYFGEVKTLCLRLLNEYKTIARSGVDVTILNENQILNTLFPGSSLVTFMALMDHSLVNTLETDKTTFLKMEPFLRCFWALCYYSCSVEDVKNHPNAFPLVSKEVNRLVGETFNHKVQRLKDLLQSFEGSDMKNATGRLSFRPVYPTDYHLEKLLRDVGDHTSQIAHVEEVSFVVKFSNLPS